MSDAVKELKTLLHDQPENPIRHQQAEEYREEAQRLEAIVKAPQWIEGANRGQANQTYRRINKMLQDQAPKPIEEAERRDRVAKLAEVVKGEIREGMLTQEEMRRNPAGAVDVFLKQEGSRAGKDAILTWKRAMRALDPDNADEDYTNVERFRPAVRTQGPATYMADAQIPGNFAMSALAKENWPLGEPGADTPLKQAKKREMTQTQLAALAAGRAKRAAQLAGLDDTPAPAQGE